MRIALVSPYSWTYPGGVTRHIEALARELIEEGHDARILAPFDPPDSLATRLHRGHEPQGRPLPENLISLGRTIGFPANGAVSNLSMSPLGVATMRRELQTGGYDVVHVHEPVAPALAWDALMSTDVPLVGTFHCYSDNVVSNNLANVIGARRRLNRLGVRIAVSEAAAWTGQRFYGGRYRIIPNGVHVPADLLSRHFEPTAPGEPLKIVFIGQSVERKGLPILLRAFEALREHVAATLTLIGVTATDVREILENTTGIEALGKVDDETKLATLGDADVLCAPSLGGESFGMVLTEAFAAGVPVVASHIAGYSDVVRDGIDGLLVPRGDATALAEALRDLALMPERRAAMARAAAERAERFAWPRVAAEVVEAYEDAIAVPSPATVPARMAVRRGFKPADGLPAVRAARLQPLEPNVEGSRAGRAALRRAGVVLAGGAGLAASWFALQRVGVHRIAESLVHSSPPWVLVALGLMCLSMVVRAVAWHAILRAALPSSRVRFSDALQGTTIGVLMSATLPARLGEPARAMIVARRVGRPKETLPVVAGTLISQTLLNIVALMILGVTMFSTVHYFDGHHAALVVFAITPILVLLAVLAAPALLRSGLPSRSERVSRWVHQARAAATAVRGGLAVFSQPRLGLQATSSQLLAWAIQWLSCYVLLVAFGLDEQAGVGAAAAVLFAVNVTAVLPATPSNLGVFQAACAAVLTGAYGVSSADALGYGIVLQAVEIATAVFMGTPALLREGLTWKDVRLRAMHASPVELAPVAVARRDGAVGDQV